MPASKKINSWYGWTPDRPDHRDKLYATIARAPKKMPSSVDLRGLCSPVENQGDLGSCTANALVGNLEFLEKKAGRPPVDMSRLFVYYNERALEGTIHSDAGALIRDGIKTLVKQGACTEKKWPYKIARFRARPTAACFKDAASHQVTSYHRILSLKEMKTCLAEGYPFVFGFTVYDSFESAAVAKSGVLNLPAPREKTVGGHAVMAVGYNDKTARFTIRNSWGADWGMDGYFTMPYNYVSNRNLSDDFWTIRATE